MRGVVQRKQLKKGKPACGSTHNLLSRRAGLASLGVVSITLKDFQDFNDLKVLKDAGLFP